MDSGMRCKHCQESFQNSHFCDEVGRIVKSTDPEDVIISAVIAGLTDSVLLGAALGGSLFGAILGDSLDGDLE